MEDKQYEYCEHCNKWVEGMRENPMLCGICGNIDRVKLTSKHAHEYAKSQMMFKKLKKDGVARRQHYEAYYWGAINHLDSLARECEQLIQQDRKEREARAYKQGWDSAGGEAIASERDERREAEIRIEELDNAIANLKPLTTVDSLVNLWRDRMVERKAELERDVSLRATNLM